LSEFHEADPLDDIARRVAEAYRWHRRLGHGGVQSSHAHVVFNPACPSLWDANHVDAVTARSVAEIDGVLAAMEAHLGHTPWRVAHTDGFTPDSFLARLALEGYAERPATIQMVLDGDLADTGCDITLAAVEDAAGWAMLRGLMAEDVAEGRKTGDLALSEALSEALAADMVAAARTKAPHVGYHLVLEEGRAVAYGARAVAPGRVGLIEDLFTRPAFRRPGIATALIAAFVAQLRREGCEIVFLGALATEAPKALYARLGFRPVGLARTWVKPVPE
jgi:GNAT superfamily N-acetyltransferase